MLSNQGESCTMRVGMERRERSHSVEVDREEFMNLVELKWQVNLNAWSVEREETKLTWGGNVATCANPDMCQRCSVVDQD